jgi:hypothetical protein
MTGTTINSSHDGIILGMNYGYTCPLTITANGVLFAGRFYAALDLPAGYTGNAVIVNQGLITAAFDNQRPAIDSNGATGVALASPVTLTNTGEIIGGNGSAYRYNTKDSYTYIGVGGPGIYVSAAASNVSIFNSGLIQAGETGFYNSYGNTGGTGVVLRSGNHVMVTNAGTILGGLSGQYNNDAHQGGAGLSGLAGGSLANSGAIIGGGGASGYYSLQPSGEGGDGVVVSGALQIVNTGTIAGGKGGTVTHGGQGGTGAFIGQSQGVQAQGNFTNSGLLTGGAGGDGIFNAGTGGTGVQFFGTTGTTGLFTFANTGTILGGSGGYIYAYDGKSSYGLDGATGGVGIAIAGLGKFSNAGTISGGAGGGATGDEMSQNGGAGGIGAYVGQSKGTPVQAYLINSGLITGGAGGGGVDGGTGGAGLYLFGTVLNTGVITGGVPGPYVVAGYGGDGVKFFGGVLVNAGTIGARYGYGTAIGFAGNTLGVASTLVVDPGAVFVGYVTANFSAPDVLELAGDSKTAFTGIGTQFSGFNNISFASGAQWKIEGTTAALAQGETIAGFAAGDSIKITDAAAASGKVTVKKNGIVTIKDGSSQVLVLHIGGAKKGETDFKFANDTLTKTAAKMAFIAPPSHQAATTVAPASSTPWVAAASPPAPLTPASAHSFGAIDWHDAAAEKWSLPLITLTS